MTRTVLSLSLALLLAACSEPESPPAQTASDAETTPATPPPAAPEPPRAPATSQAGDINAVLAGAHRSEENRARDAWRHPKETLAFFGVEPTMTVIEVTPGAGWYTEVLAPWIRGQGRYVAMVFDPAATQDERMREYFTRGNAALREKLAANPELYGEATVIEVDPQAPVLGEPGSADAVLTFRNAHNWIAGGSPEVMFDAFFDVLEPGGVLGVVDHRANEGTEFDPESGYVTEAQVIELAEAAGFELAEKSEINANPKDTKDHPNGVWTLPPTSNTPEGEDAQKYADIGESDRMTLKFVKPEGAAADAEAAGNEGGGGEAAPSDDNG